MKNVSTMFVALAALCWGLSGGIGGILTDRGWDPVVVSFYRGAIGFLFVLVWLALRPRGSGLSFIFYIVGLNHTAPAVASVLAMVEPVTASLFGVAVLDESLAGLQIIGMALILVTVSALSVNSSTQWARKGSE
jgi:drug/metabolite transporter, DME family